MQLTDLVTSLEVSKQLKAAGFPQESVFKWVDVLNGWELCTVSKFGNWQSLESNSFGIFHEKTRAFAAPTASEIGEQLPLEIETKDNAFFIDFDILGDHDIRQYGVIYSNSKMVESELPKFSSTLNEVLLSEVADTEADARAKMWLYLKQHNLLGKR